MDNIELNIQDYPLYPTPANVYRLIKCIGHANFTVAYNIHNRIGKVYVHDRNTEIGYHVEHEFNRLFDVENEIIDAMIIAIDKEK